MYLFVTYCKKICSNYWMLYFLTNSKSDEIYFRPVTAVTIFFLKLRTTLDLQIRGLYYSVLADRQCIRVLTAFLYLDLDGSPVMYCRSLAMRLQSSNTF